MEFYMFGAGMLFLGVLLGVVGIAVYKSQVTSLSWFWCDNAKPKYGEYIAGKIETFSRGKHLLCKPFDFHTAAYIWNSPLSQCLPDEVAKLRDDRRELEPQRQHQQDLLRSEVIHSEEELLKKDVIDHTEVWRNW